MTGAGRRAPPLRDPARRAIARCGESPSSCAIPTSVLGDRLGRREDVLRRVRARAAEVPLARELAVAHDDEAVRLAPLGARRDLLELRRVEAHRRRRDLLPLRAGRLRERGGRDAESEQRTAGECSSQRRQQSRHPLRVPAARRATPLLRLVRSPLMSSLAEPSRASALFSFPNPVNEVSARLVAGGVVLLAPSRIASGQSWLVAVIAYGFVARVLTGPTLSPLGQLVTRVITPRLRVAPKLRRRAAEALRAGDRRRAHGLGRGARSRLRPDDRGECRCSRS